MPRAAVAATATVLVLAGAGGAGALAAPGEPVSRDRDCLRVARGIDLQTATIPQLQDALARGTITSVDLIDAYRTRIAAYAPWNAIRELDPDAHLRAAQRDRERAEGLIRGPLHGIPVLLKDNVGTVDLPTTAGSVALEGQIPRRDAFITARLRSAGAIVLGKANLSEWANWMATGMPNGYSSLGGQVRNAHDGLDPSGSSAGSGVAASLALAAATIGTETSGSILSPALANGVVGLKTTRGLVSRTGIIPLAERFDVPGPMVRSVADAAVVLSAIAGSDPEDPATAEADLRLPPGGDYTTALRSGATAGVRIAYDPAESPDPTTPRGAAYAAVLERLRAGGAVLVESGGFGVADTSGVLLELPAIYTQFHEGLDHYLQTEQREGARVRSLADVIAVGSAQPEKVRYGQDKLLTSLAAPAVKEVGEAQAQPAIDQSHVAIDATLDAADAVAFLAPDGAHIGIGAAGGHPTLAVPMGHPGGDRFGITLLGRRFAEAQLLAVGAALQDASPVRVPPTQVEGGAEPLDCSAAGRGVFGAARPATAPAKAPAGPGLQVRLTRPAFSARRTGRTRKVAVRVRLRGGSLRNVRLRVVAPGGRTVLRGAAGRLSRASTRVTLRLVRRPRPGVATLVLTARTPDGTKVRRTLRVRVTR